MIQKSLVLLFVWFFCLSLKAQQPAIPNNWERFVDQNLSANAEASHSYYLYQYAQAAQLNALQNAGWQVMRRLDQQHVILRKPAESTTREEAGLRAANDDWKLSPNFEGQMSRGVIKDLIVKSTDPHLTHGFLNANGVQGKDVFEGMIRVSSSDAMLITLLIGSDEVTYVGAESQNALFDSRVLDMNLNPNRVNLVHRHFPELRGQGMVLSIKENGYNTEDLDLVTRDRPSDLSATINSNHATEMATIAAGAGNSSLNGLGVAGSATLTSSFLDALFPDAVSEYRSLNVALQNHSYGTPEIENFYGASAEAYDQVANANPELLNVFSVGNLGESIPESGPYANLAGYANLSGNFKASKNTLSVGSVDTVGRKVTFVSNGPAHDGRVKPELVAYSVFGSSNSAALTSGVALLLQQAYQEAQGVLPPSALIKALLINGAQDVGAEGPDYLTGYGNLDAYESLQTLHAGQYAAGTVQQGAQEEVTINVPENVQELKVTLVWNDPAAAANTNIALVNNLDLVVEDAGANDWLPWVLDPAADRLASVATRGADALNNVERVTIRNPAAGSFKIKVSGTNVAQGPQSYQLVWSWQLEDQFDWKFPVAQDNMPYNGETTGYFRWESSLAAGTGQLEYSIDGGMNWELIDDAADLSAGHYRWASPDLKTSAIARMVVAGQSYESEAFTISRPDRIGVGFSCADSVRIQWAQQDEIDHYEVLSLTGASMGAVANTTDTSFTFNKSDFASRFFAVQPVLANGARPIRSATFNYDFQGVGCYIISLSTELDGDEGVFVNLNLGTTAGVQQVEFQRQTEMGDWTPFLTLTNSELKSNLRVLDEGAIQGLNTYRASLLFENGERLQSGESSAYFLTTRPFLVFPNPQPRGELLNVFSRQFVEGVAVTLILHDRTGKRAFEFTLNSDRFAFDLSNLPAGLYTYRIVAGDISQTGRLIVNQ